MNYKKKYMGHGMYKMNPFYGQANISLGADKFNFANQFGNTASNMASSGAMAAASSAFPPAMAVQLGMQAMNAIGSAIDPITTDAKTGMQRANVGAAFGKGILQNPFSLGIPEAMAAAKQNQKVNLASANIDTRQEINENLGENFVVQQGSDMGNTLQNPYMMYGASNLKSVPADKQKSLGQLPEFLRNRFGYAKHGLKNPDKADLNNDNKLSSYEVKRGKAIENNMKFAKYGKSKNPYYGQNNLINIERNETIYTPDDSDIGYKVAMKLDDKAMPHTLGGENFSVPENTMVLNSELQNQATEAIDQNNVNEFTGITGLAENKSKAAMQTGDQFSGDIGQVAEPSGMNPFYASNSFKKGQNNLVQQDNTATNMMTEQKASDLANYKSRINAAKQMIDQGANTFKYPNINLNSFLSDIGIPTTFRGNPTMPGDSLEINTKTGKTREIDIDGYEFEPSIFGFRHSVFGTKPKIDARMVMQGTVNNKPFESVYQQMLNQYKMPNMKMKKTITKMPGKMKKTIKPNK